jgi:ribosomal protein S3
MQTYNSNIHYSQAVAYTINGTIGIKIWTFENY